VDPARLIKPKDWEWLGPRNVGGRTRALAIDPADPSRMWAGSVAGGVWASKDGGQSWVPDDAGLAVFSISCLVMDPTSTTLYAGTGEYVGDGRTVSGSAGTAKRGLRGAGIFRTDHGGWKRITGTATPDFQFVNRLTAARGGKIRTVLLAATASGLYRCTSDRIEDWRKTISGPFADVEFHPSNPALAVAGTFDSSTGKAYFSQDGGRHWCEAAHAPWDWKGRVELAYARARPSIVYASVNASRDGSIPVGTIFQSTDGGKSYIVASIPPRTADPRKPFDYLAGHGNYSHCLWASDPADPSLVIVGGADLFRSRDGGKTLEQISANSDDLLTHADHHVIVEHPHYGRPGCRTVFFGNDGGIFKSADLATVGSGPELKGGWQALDNGYGTVQFYGACGVNRTGTLLGGAQDNDARLYSIQGKIANWSRVDTGDGGFCASDETDPAVQYLYTEGQRMALLRLRISMPGNLIVKEGINGDLYDGTWKSPGYLIDDAKEKRTNFIAPFQLDPNCPERLLAGGISLWRTSNVREPNDPKNPLRSGPRWTTIKDPLPSEAGAAGVPISAVAIATGKSDVIWVGYNNGRLFRTVEGTAMKPRWEPMDIPAAAGRYCTRIVINPKNHEHVYVLFGGYQNDNLWTLKQGGSGWRCMKVSLTPRHSDNVLAAPLRSFAIHPDHPELFYLGTDVGLFCSPDSGKTWHPVNEGPARCPVDELFWMNRTLVAATHARGIYRVDLSKLAH
jgi:hypothetical protein